MLDEETWRLIEVAGAWVSGIGSLMASIVALYYGWRRHFPLVTVEDGTLSVEGESGVTRITHVILQVRNIGLVPVTVLGPCIRVFLLPKGRLTITLPLPRNKFPAEVPAGTVYTYMIPIKKWYQDLDYATEDVTPSQWPFARLFASRSVRVGFKLWNGTDLLRKPTQPLIRDSIVSFFVRSRSQDGG